MALMAVLVIGCAATPQPRAGSASGANPSLQERPPAKTADSAGPHAASAYSHSLEDRDAVGLDLGLSDEDRLAIVDADPAAVQCSDVLMRAQWEQDVLAVATPEAHYDNCTIDASTAYLRHQLAEANRLDKAGDAYQALDAIGRAVHSLQDFYIHTNYVELAATHYSRMTDVPDIELWKPESDTDLASLKAQGLVSGTVLWEAGSCAGAGALSHRQLNKDDPKSARGATLIPGWNCSHYRAAYELARIATRHMLRARLPALPSVKARCGANYGFAMTLDNRRD